MRRDQRTGLASGSRRLPARYAAQACMTSRLRSSRSEAGVGGLGLTADLVCKRCFRHLARHARLRAPVAERGPHPVGRSCDAETPERLAEHRGVDPSSLRAPEHDPAAAVELPGFLEDLQGPPGQGNPVLALRLHAVGGNGPDIVLDLVARRAPDLVRACRGQDHELERQPDTGMGLRVADHGQSRRHLAVRERLVVEAGITLRKLLWDNDLATRYGLRVSHGVSEGCQPYYPLGLRQKRRDLEARPQHDRPTLSAARTPSRKD